MFSRNRLLALALAILVSLAASGSAHALPVFSSSGLTEEAISPNGDGIQDLTVILYTVEVDTAFVRIVLRHAGGTIRDTLQVFSNRGRGIHSLPFDGTTGSGAVPDGLYSIEVLGVGTQGEGSETAALPLTIDRIAPPITSWDIVAPGATLRDGDLLTLQVCSRESPDSVSLDLSSLDSAFDPAFVTTTLFGANCFRFEYTVSLGNTLPDADSIPARVRLADRAGNVSEAVLDLCLSNSPPVVTETALINQSTIFRNGDEIRVEIEFSSLNVLGPGADFSAIDSNFSPDAVSVEDLGGQRFRLSYRIDSGNTRPDGSYRLVVFGNDQGCGYAADSSLVVTLDNAGLESTLIANAQLSLPAFSPAGLPGESVGFPAVDIRFDVIEDTVIVGITTLARLRNESQTERVTILRTQPDGVLARGSYTYSWDGRGVSSNHTPERLEEQDLSIEIHVTSIELDRQVTQVLTLQVDRTPPQLVGFPPPEELLARNGQVLRIPVSYDAALGSLAADLSGVDSQFNPSLVFTTSQGNGNFEISYGVTANNARPDSTNITIPITAVDQAGNQSVSNVVRACLDNLPPRFLSAMLLDNPGPFRTGQRISLRTEWSTEATQGNLVVTADFSAIDDQFDPSQVAVVERGNNVFDIGYTLNPASTITTGVELPVRVTAGDDPSRGCGATTVDAVKVTLDNEAPSRPTLTASAQVATEPFITLSGEAPEAVQVRIERSGNPVDTLDVDPLNFTFSGQVGLLAGINSFTARSLDSAGNLSPQSGAPIDVFLYEGSSFDVPARFVPNSEFFVASNVATSGVRIRIFNLDGLEIQRLEEGPGDLYRIAWDGTDTSGNVASSGPYIAVAEVEVNGAIQDRIRKAFVFLRGGTEP